MFKIYSALLYSVYPLLRLIGFFSSSLQAQLSARKKNFENIKPHCDVLLFCSSAGEYEQAKPLIHRFETQGKRSVICFFSLSGYNFAEQKQERTPFFVAPFDLLNEWGKVFEKLKPKLTIVIRHELWPGFLYTASKHSELALVGLQEPHKQSINFVKKKLLNLFDIVFSVSKDAQGFYQKSGVIAPIHCVGDPKIDRAFERKLEQENRSEAFRLTLKDHIRFDKCFILGSAWQADVDIFLESYKAVKAQLEQTWLFIIAPHDPSDPTLRYIERASQTANLNHFRFSKLTELRNETGPLVIIIDSIGNLAELYGCADLCLVGGGFHFRVHNTLEPMVHGLPICFGPRFQTEQEARFLIKHDLAQVVNSAADLSKWWLKREDSCSLTEVQLKKFVENASGASDRIMQYLKRKL